MPSEEWFRENPKVSAYISRELHQKLETWMQENGVKKVSQALTEILEAFLEPSKAGDRQDALMALEQKFEDRFAALESRVTTINLAIAEIQSSPTIVQSSNKQQLSLLDDIAKSPKEQPEQPTPTTETHKDSSPNVDQNNSSRRMTNREVEELTKRPYNTVKSWHQKGQTIEEQGYKLTPVRENGKPMWDARL